MTLKHTPKIAPRWFAIASAETKDNARVHSAHLTYGALLASLPITHEPTPMGWADVIALTRPGADIEEVASALEEIARILRAKGAPCMAALEAPSTRAKMETAHEAILREDAERAVSAGATWLDTGEMPEPDTSPPATVIHSLE